MEDVSVLTGLTGGTEVDLRQAYPMQHRVSSFTATSSFYRHYRQGKYEIRMEPEEVGCEIEYLATASFLTNEGDDSAKKNNVRNNTQSPTLSTISPPALTVERHKAQVAASILKHGGVSMRRTYQMCSMYLFRDIQLDINCRNWPVTASWDTNDLNECYHVCFDNFHF